MKCVYVVQKLFFFNLLSLLWWPYFCDIRQNDKNPQGIQNHKDSDDSHRIANVPTTKEEIGAPNIGLEQTLKENIVQPSVAFVNSETEIKVEKEEPVDGQITPTELESSLDEIKTSSNSDSSQETHVNNNVQKATIKRNIRQDKITQQNENVHSKELPEEQSIRSDASPTLQTEPIFATKITVPENMQQSDETKSAPSPTSPEVPVVENGRKSDLEKNIPYENTVDVASFPEAINNAHQQPQYDGMPSFDEWKKMMLAEQEKGGQKIPSPGPPGKKISSQKRRRNYSSYECGAKIVASNSEAEGTSRILNELVDEYMLNPCKAKIWFVIELCETVQASQIELANFELFSSCPKEFIVYSSDNFPTRDWAVLGTFSAAEQRVLQSFELKQEGFGKFIKIELVSYYGKEHYCPLSVVRIFGTSMVDEYEEMETLASRPDVPDDDLDRLDIPAEDQVPTNIFGSATDAVMNIVKKAAQALGQHQPLEERESNKSSDQQNVSETKQCRFISDNNKCEDSETRNESDSTLSKIINFTVPLSSVHQSLFRHLHRCDQCVSSNLGYYSSAQPHCRFFQAALGPVMFKALCDWFKEHPLVIAHEVPSAGRSINNVISGSTMTVTTTKSPPPQIMRIPPLQPDSSFTVMSSNNTSESVSSNLEKTLTVDITNMSRFRLNKTVDSNKVKPEASIEPTKTIGTSKMQLKNDSVLQSLYQKSSQILQSVEITSDMATKSAELVPEKTKEPVETKPLETVSAVAPNELFDTDALDKKLSNIEEEEQLNEILSDTTPITPEDIASVEAVTGSELPPGFKLDEKFQDMRGEQGKTEPVSISGITSASAGQKESVFMRMSNRIKALEINMSLSSQYLQELSQRYRRQMEDMQRAFNRTIGTLNDTAKKAAEKDLKQQEVINSLQSQVENLTKTVEVLMSERSYVFKQMVETHVCLMITEAIIMITIMSLCVRRISSSAPSTVPVTSNATQISSPRVKKRRNSADSGTSPVARKVKRSCSEEILVAEQSLVNAERLLIVEPVQKVKKKNKKRNRGGLQRSASQPTTEQSNPNPTLSSPNSYKEKQATSYSDESTLNHPKPKHASHRVSQSCENCNNRSTDSEKEKRPYAEPLRNLTNGTIKNLGLSPNPGKSNRLQKEKERFSFKKFLKFQKRDSI